MSDSLTNRSSRFNKLLCCLLAAMLFACGINAQALRASADSTVSSPILTAGTAKTINVGTDCITVPSSGWDSTDGSYLRFGWPAMNSGLYRVLQKNSNVALIDFDAIRYFGYFDDENDTNKYASSTVQSELGGGGYKTSGDVFCPGEEKYVQKATLSASSGVEVDTYTFDDDSSSGNIAFLLSAKQMSELYKNNSQRVKTSFYGTASDYMLRSSVLGSDTGIAIVTSAGEISVNTYVGDSTVTATQLGISPAAYVDLSGCMFASSLSHKKKSTGGALNKVEDASANKTWKLTLKDSTKSVTVQTGEKSGNVVTVPYRFTSTPDNKTNFDVTQISVVIASGPLDDTSTEIYYYGAMDNVNLYTKYGFGKFTLPNDLPATYKVYALAEDVHEDYNYGKIPTDFASDPVEITFTEKTESTVDQVNLGAKQIAVPFGGWDKTNGEYLYFGSFNNTAIKNRVLINEDGSLLLDSDDAVWTESFTTGTSTANYSSCTLYSHLKNGTDASGNSIFSDQEKACVISASLLASDESYKAGDPDHKYVFKDYAASDNLAFLISANEAYNLYFAASDRVKGSSDWLLRSADSSGYQVGYVSADGKYGSVSPTTQKPVAPATVLDNDEIFLTHDNSFSKTAALTKVANMTNKVWKTTLKTDRLTFNLGKFEQSGNQVTIPYACSGDSVTQISIMITSGDLSSSSTKVLYYGQLADCLSSGKEGTATFTLPADLPTGYKAYAFAEDVNDSGLTDYVSEPSDIFANRFEVTFANEDGSTLSKKTVDEGNKVVAPTVSPSKSYYDFVGWFDGNAANPFNFDIEITKDYTLTAKFAPTKYTITYQNVEGATNPNPDSYTIESGTITLQDASKDGYTFDGWYKVIDASNVSLNAEIDENVKITEIAQGSTGNLTLMATWTEIESDDVGTSGSGSSTTPVSAKTPRAIDSSMSSTGDVSPVVQCLLALFVSCCVFFILSVLRNRSIDKQVSHAKHSSH